MQLIEVLGSEKSEYNNFVSSQLSGSFLQSYEWGEWQAKLGREVFRYWILDTANQKIGSIQLVKMSLPLGRFYLYAPYGAVLNEEGEGKIEQLVEIIMENFTQAVFIRIEPKNSSFIPLLPSLAVKSPNIQPSVSIALDLNKTEEDILSGMHNKTRYNIKVAKKHNVEIQSELVVTPGKGLYAKEAVGLILKTQGRQGYRGWPESYYKNLIDFFALHNLSGDLKLTVYRALYEKEILASGIMIDFGEVRMYLFGGSSDKHRNVMAPYLMHWQAIQDAKAKGIKFYDFGGSEVSGGGEKGFTRFKQGFGGVVENYAGTWDVIINKNEYILYKILRFINKIKLKLGI